MDRVAMARLQLTVDVDLRRMRCALRDHRRSIALAVVPVALFVVFFFSVGLMDPFRAPELWAWLIAYIVPPLGKESVIPALVARGFSPFLVAVAILGIDMIAGLFFVWNYDHVKRVPFVGRHVDRMGAHAERLLARSDWAGRMAYVALVAFHLVPFQGAGAISTSILGRVLGFKPYRVWLAVCIGSAVSCFAIAYAAYSLVAIAGEVAISIVAAALIAAVVGAALRGALVARRATG